MNLLLDTHLVLWWLDNHQQLSPKARARIADPLNTVFLSAVTCWEIAIKASTGKLKIPPDFFPSLEQENFQALPFTAAHAQRVAELPWFHRDPFDRALVAQAAMENLTFLTADAELTGYGKWVETV